MPPRAPKPLVLNAPPNLVERLKQSENFKGRDILQRLLTEPKMDGVWKRLKKQAKDDHYDKLLFDEILWILHRATKTERLRKAPEQQQSAPSTYPDWSDPLEALPSNRPIRRQMPPQARSRSEELNFFKTLKEHIEQLAEEVETALLNERVYELTPEVMEVSIFGWRELDVLDRHEKAGQVLAEWPTVIDVLAGLARRAEEGITAAEQPRIVEKVKGKFRQTYFVRQLGAYMAQQFGSPHYGSIASITNVVFNTQFDAKEIENKIKS